MAQYGNWLGVLKWSLAQTDGTGDSEFHAMSEEVSTAEYQLRCHVEKLSHVEEQELTSTARFIAIAGQEMATGRY